MDLYRTRRQPSGALVLAELDFAEGDNQLLLKLVGKNDASSGFGLDLSGLVFDRSVP